LAEKDLNELFLDTLKDIYYAEKHILKALPKMAKAANSDQLRAAFEKHFDETEGQVTRLEQIFEMLGKPARGKKCDAIEGIIDRHWTPVCWRPHKPSSTTRFRATAR
jgi:ferritin-like metal-binding protein YciE